MLRSSDIEAIDLQDWQSPFLKTDSSPKISRATKSLVSSGVSMHSEVETHRGKVPAGELRLGDKVLTRNGSYATLRWVGYSRSPESSHVRLSGANGLRGSTLMPLDQLLSIAHPMNDVLFGAPVVMCSAKDYAEAGQASIDVIANPAMVHLLFDRLELIKCGPVWVESMVPDMASIRAIDSAIADEMVTAVPRLASLQSKAYYLQKKPVLNARETRMLFEA